MFLNTIYLKKNWRLWLIIFLAILSFAIFGLGTEPLNRDSGQFLAIADNILTQGKFSADGQNLTSVREPGYPLFLTAVFEVFGDHNYLAVNILQFILFLSLIIYFYCLCRRLFPDKNWPLLAVGAAAVFPSFNFYNGQILSESLFTFFLGASVLLFIDLAFNKFYSRRKIIMLGALLGLAAIVRVEGLIAAAVIIIGLLIFKYFKPALIVLGIFLILVCPWMLRNYYHFGNFSLTNGRQEVQIIADATLISRARLIDYPRVSLVRIKKGFGLHLTKADTDLEFSYNENDIMWRTSAIADFFTAHPEMAPRNQVLAKGDPIDAYAQESGVGRLATKYCEKIILQHPLVAITDMFFNTIGTLGPELPTVIKDNKFFHHKILAKAFSVVYALLYLAIYVGLFLLLLKIIPFRRQNYPLYILIVIALGILAGHSIFSFTTRFNTPLFAIYFILIAYYLNFFKQNEI